MPSLNITLTQEELAAVRTAAGDENLSLRAFVHRAVVSAASDHKRRVAEGARLVAERSAELNPPTGLTTNSSTRDDVLVAGALAVGHALEVGDYGLLDAAVARPRATAFGVDAYPDLFSKAAALLQSLARNHALIDGNKRTAWASAWTYLYLNGIELPDDFDVDAAEEFMNEVAQQAALSVEDIASTLVSFTKD